MDEIMRCTSGDESLWKMIFWNSPAYQASTYARKQSTPAFSGRA